MWIEHAFLKISSEICDSTRRQSCHSYRPPLSSNALSRLRKCKFQLILIKLFCMYSTLFWNTVVSWNSMRHSRSVTVTLEVFSRIGLYEHSAYQEEMHGSGIISVRFKPQKATRSPFLGMLTFPEKNLVKDLRGISFHAITTDHHFAVLILPPRITSTYSIRTIFAVSRP